MNSKTSRTYGHYGYYNWSFGNVLENERRSGSPGDSTLKPICDICGKPRGNSCNHDRCAKKRQDKYAKENS